ncbi:MAG: four helix bundle protein [bacterium]|nr:four helix bundle protein [bacterium]
MEHKLNEKITSYKDLTVWQKAHQNDLAIISLFERMNTRGSLAMVLHQLLRSMTSTSANIAEGYGCFRGKEFPTFLGYALRSAWESDNWLTLLIEVKEYQNKFNLEQVQVIYKRNQEVIRMLISLIKKLSQN